jgi:N-acetylmuramoyl-L-alanine amidase
MAVFCFLPHALFAQNAGGQPGRIFTLDEAVGALGASGDGMFRWDPFFQEGSFSAGGHYGAFPAASSPGESGMLIVDNKDIYTVPLPYFDSGALVFPGGFIETVKTAFSAASTQETGYRVAAIIIDAGHGGRDPGAVAEHTISGKKLQVRESQITLNASLMLRDMLVRQFPDKRILMTRERDVFLSLDERTDIANSVPIRDNEAIIFISLHANYASSKKAGGFEVWHITPNFRRDLLGEGEFADSPELRNILNQLTEEAFLTESVLIAQSILDGLQRATGGSVPNRGLKAENWFVVRRSNMPAVLVELGFVSNQEDAVMMTSESGLRKMIEGVYSGITDFVGEFERSGGVIIAQ